MKRKLPLVVGLVLAVAVLVAGFRLRPAVPEADGPPTGDPQLAGLVERSYDGPRHRLGVAVVDLGAATPVRYAGFGTDEHGAFEIGSISKALTGLLLADAVQRGQVRLDQPVGELLPLDGAPVAQVTLDELASHRSGLPRIAPGLKQMGAGLRHRMAGVDAYPYDVEELLAQARAAKTDGRGKSAYSNLGGALLGQALARKAGTDYADLLASRLLRPAGMTETRLPHDRGRRRAARVWRRRPDRGPVAGRRLCSGGERGVDPGRPGHVGALAARQAAGGEALEPRHDYRDDGKRIGMHWISSPLPGTDRTMTWHNGGTGGYRSFLGLDPERRLAVVVLSDVAHDVDDLGAELLKEA